MPRRDVGNTVGRGGGGGEVKTARRVGIPLTSTRTGARGQRHRTAAAAAAAAAKTPEIVKVPPVVGGDHRRRVSINSVAPCGGGGGGSRAEGVRALMAEGVRALLFEGLCRQSFARAPRRCAAPVPPRVCLPPRRGLPCPCPCPCPCRGGQFEGLGTPRNVVCPRRPSFGRLRRCLLRQARRKGGGGGGGGGSGWGVPGCAGCASLPGVPAKPRPQPLGCSGGRRLCRALSRLAGRERSGRFFFFLGRFGDDENPC